VQHNNSWFEEQSFDSLERRKLANSNFGLIKNKHKE